MSKTVEPTPVTEPSLARSTAIMTVGTVLSRATGLLRLMAVAAALGVAGNKVADTYNLANTAPNIIYELVLGGILTSVFVPVFVDLLEKEGRERAWAVGSAILNISLVTLAVITVIGIIAAPLIAKFYAFRLEGAEAARQQQAMTSLLRMFIPQIVFYGLTAITAGLLNAHKRFGPPMYTPVLNNLVVIAAFVAFYAVYGGDVALEDMSTGQLVLMGLGTTAGVVVMAFAQLPFLKGLGRYQWTLSLRHPALRRLGRMSLFVVGYVITNQLGYLVVQWLANGEQGAYTAYVSAFMFFMLPHGLFAVSIMTALLPSMSEHASNARWDEFRERLSTGVRATFLLILPAAVGYFVLGEPIVRLLLERGNMTASDTELVAGVLRVFVLGLVPFSLFQLFLRAFYSTHDTRTPFLINVAAVVLNTAVNIPMFALFGVRGLAAGMALAYTFGVLLQARSLRRRLNGLDGRRIAASFARIGAAAAGMGLAVWGALAITERLVDPGTLVNNLTITILPVVVGAGVYLGLASLLEVPELQFARGIVSRRLGRGRSGPAP